MTTNKSISPFQISQSLHSKYTADYFFFTAKNVNQLVYSVGNALCIQFDHLKSYYDELEYLKRTYRQVGLSGKSQIEDRIKMTASKSCIIKLEFYDKQTTGNNFPIVLDPELNIIFRKRLSRLKKIKNQSQNSHSQVSSSSFVTGSLSFSIDQDVLKDINLGFSTLMNDFSSQYLAEKQVFDQQHNIYEACSVSQDYLETQGSEQVVNLRENRIDHLIWDFKEIDADSVISFYKDIKKSKNGSIILIGIWQQQQKISQKSSKSQSVNSKNSTKLIKKNIYSQQYIEEYKKLINRVQNAEDNIYQTKRHQVNRRQSIRDKAEKLLQKIKIPSN